MSPDEHRSGNSPPSSSKPGSHQVRWANSIWRRLPTRPFFEPGPVTAGPTEPAGESSTEPQHDTTDWRPVFEGKMQGMLSSLGASKAFERYSSIAETEEACHNSVMGPQDTNNVAHIEKCDYTTAVSPDADFDALRIEEARKQRIEALQRIIRRREELDSVAQDHNEASTRSLEESEERLRNELALLRNYVAPRWAKALRTLETVKSVEQPEQPADPSPLMRTTEEMHPNSLRPGSPQAAAPTAAAMAQAVGRERSPRQDGVKGWGKGDSDASTMQSAKNAAVWRSQSKYDESAKEEERRRNQDKRSSGSANTLSELEEWWRTDSPEPKKSERRDSALAILEEVQRGIAGEKGKVQFLGADRMSAPPSSLDSVPVPGGRRHRPTKKHTPKTRVARRKRESEEPVSGSMVLEPARFTRRLTAAEKGKGVAECECEECQPQEHKRVRFDDSAMDKAEEGPGLSQEGFVKTMRENRRRMEAQARGEGASSWAMSDPNTGLVGPVGLDMFKNPRPAPQVPMRGHEGVNVVQGERAQKKRINKHDIGQPMDRYGIFPGFPEFSRPGLGTRVRATYPGGGEPDPMAVQMDGRSRHLVWRALSRRFRR